MDSLKAARFEAVRQVIHHKWGQQALQSVRAYQAKTQQRTIPTGFPDLDTALGGGIPYQRITLLEGNATSGMTSLTYHLIASAHANGLVCVYLDLSQTFDADYAIRCYSVQEEQLLLVYADDLTDALALARDVLLLPYTGLIVLDAALAESVPLFQGLQSGFSRLKLPLRQSRWTLLALLPQTAQWATLPAALHLGLQRSDWQYQDALISGLWSTVQVRRNQRQPGTQTTVISIVFPDDLA